MPSLAHWQGMERPTFQPRSPGELREMARHANDPVVRDALATLADFIENEGERKEGKDAPWTVKH